MREIDGTYHVKDGDILSDGLFAEILACRAGGILVGVVECIGEGVESVAVVLGAELHIGEIGEDEQSSRCDVLVAYLLLFLSYESCRFAGSGSFDTRQSRTVTAVVKGRRGSRLRLAACCLFVEVFFYLSVAHADGVFECPYVAHKDGKPVGVSEG